MHLGTRVADNNDHGEIDAYLDCRIAGWSCTLKPPPDRSVATTLGESAAVLYSGLPLQKEADRRPSTGAASPSCADRVVDRTGKPLAVGAAPIVQEAPDEFFTAGLFLAIGLLQSACDDIAAAADVARLRAPHRPTYELACGRVDRTVTGAELAQKLKLSDKHIEAVAKYHAKEPAGGVLARGAWCAGLPARSREAICERGVWTH